MCCQFVICDSGSRWSRYYLGTYIPRRLCSGQGTHGTGGVVFMTGGGPFLTPGPHPNFISKICMQKQIIVIIKGGITVVGEEVDGILSILLKVCHQLYLCVEYILEIRTRFICPKRI